MWHEPRRGVDTCIFDSKTQPPLNTTADARVVQSATRAGSSDLSGAWHESQREKEVAVGENGLPELASDGESEWGGVTDALHLDEDASDDEQELAEEARCKLKKFYQ